MDSCAVPPRWGADARAASAKRCAGRWSFGRSSDTGVHCPARASTKQTADEVILARRKGHRHSVARADRASVGGLRDPPPGSARSDAVGPEPASSGSVFPIHQVSVFTAWGWLCRGECAPGFVPSLLLPGKSTGVATPVERGKEKAIPGAPALKEATRHSFTLLLLLRESFRLKEHERTKPDARECRNLQDDHGRVFGTLEPLRIRKPRRHERSPGAWWWT